MNVLMVLIPVALFLGGIGLAAFIWSVRSGQYDDLDGAARRILIDDEDLPDDSRSADRASRTSADRDA